MEGMSLGRDVPYTTPEQLEVAEFVDRLWERADAEYHRLFALIAFTAITLAKDIENGTTE